MKRLFITIFLISVLALGLSAQMACPTPTIVASGPICSSTSSITLTTLPGTSYYWIDNATGATITNNATYSGANTNVLTINNPYSLVGKKLKVVVVNPTCGGAVSDVYTLTSAPLPTITTQPVSLTTCTGNTATLSSTVSNASSYQWYSTATNGAIPATQPWTGTMSSTLSMSQAVAGQYYLIASNACGNSVTSNTVTLTVKSFTVSSNGPVCAGTTLSLTGPAGMTNYKWSGPNGFTSTLQSPTVSTSSTTDMSGTYTLTATNSDGCTSSASTSVVVNAYPYYLINYTSISLR